jgi:hypothetical protein
MNHCGRLPMKLSTSFFTVVLFLLLSAPTFAEMSNERSLIGGTLITKEINEGVVRIRSESPLTFTVLFANPLLGSSAEKTGMVVKMHYGDGFVRHDDTDAGFTSSVSMDQGVPIGFALINHDIILGFGSPGVFFGEIGEGFHDWDVAATNGELLFEGSDFAVSVDTLSNSRSKIRLYYKGHLAMEVGASEGPWYFD